MKKSELRKLIKEELLKEGGINSLMYDAHGAWHKASMKLHDTIKKTKDKELLKTFSKAWDLADDELVRWFEEQADE